jgi:predicted MPP superfamily phosphohydrolase
LKVWPLAAVAFITLFLALTHYFVYASWIHFSPGLPLSALPVLRVGMGLASISFIAASLASFRFHGGLVRMLYGASALWMGFFNFFFWAAVLSWAAMGLFGLSQALFPTLATADPAHFRGLIGGWLLVAAVLASLWGLINARLIRVVEHTVKLRNLPESWQGRTILLMSDVHLGHIQGLWFSRWIARIATRLAPDAILLPGDLFDGGAADADHVLAPLSKLNPPRGIYFSSGNHDEFGNMEHFTQAIERAGIRVLANQSVDVEGLRIMGVAYPQASSPLHLHTILERLLPKGEQRPTSILLNHVPNRLPLIEQAGVDLVVCGHTHSGQIFPFTWLTQRIFGRYTHGLHGFGSLQVCTSSGVGVWGPPMRVGSQSEVVLLRLEAKG